MSFDGHRGSTCHDWQATCWCLGFDGFRFGTMPIYHLDLNSGTERATGQMKEPLHLIFRIGTGTTYSQFFLKCAVTSAITYNKPFTLFSLVWISGLRRHGFDQDGLPKMEKKMIPIAFGTLAMSMEIKVVFGCIATIDYLPSNATLLENYFALIGKLETKSKNPIPPHLLIWHSKYSLPPSKTSQLLSTNVKRLWMAWLPPLWILIGIRASFLDQFGGNLLTRVLTLWTYLLI